MRKRRRSLLLSSILIAAVALAGCASADPDDANGSGEPTDPGEPVALQPVSVGLGSSTNQGAEVLVAYELGLFEKYGLDVTLHHLNGSSQVPIALNSGDIEIGTGDGIPMAVNMLRGIDVVFFGGNILTHVQEMWAGPGVDSVEDLEGKTFGSSAPGSLSDLALTDVLAETSLTRDDMEIVNFQDATAKIAALASGAIDALLTSPPQGDRALGEVGAKMIFDASHLPNMSQSYVTTTAFADEHGDVLEAFLKATREADVIAKTEPDQVISVVSDYIGVTDEEILMRGYDFFRDVWMIDPRIPSELLQQVFETASETAEIDVSNLDLSEFYLDSPVNSLIEEGFIDEMEAQAR